MNVLEHYIKEIHSVDPYDVSFDTKEFAHKKFVKVDVTTNCYGTTRRTDEIFSVAEWEKIKKQGFWMS
ncbi:hypothetical protein LCL98_14700 [Rossellomorea aquimaris]|nr:hypothetical protein [Rossellomorea aquimaris]